MSTIEDLVNDMLFYSTDAFKFGIGLMTGAAGYLFTLLFIEK